jgi:N6-L-threonylcarbamoyladenine synthase
VEKYRAKTLIVAGGVASNKHLKEEIKKTLGGKTKILFPGHGLATDNSVMIGMAGYLKYLKNPKKRYKIRAEGGLRL